MYQVPVVDPPRQPGWVGVLTLHLASRLKGLTIAASPAPNVIVPAASGVTINNVTISSTVPTDLLVQITIAVGAPTPSSPQLTLVYTGSDGILKDPVSFILPIAGPALNAGRTAYA
jgi:hypothetical protein